MKKVILLAIISLATIKLFAQEQKKDTTKIKWGYKTRIWIFEDKLLSKKDSIKKERKKGGNFTHWGGFDVGICALNTFQNQFKVPSPDAYNTNYFLNLKYNRSWYFSLNLFEKNIRLYKNYVTLVTGLGAEWDSYSFRNNIILSPDSSHTNSTTIKMDTASSNLKYIKNQLKATYIKIPLLIELNTNSYNANKSFHLAAGIEFGYKIDSWTKRKYEEDGTTYKAKLKGDYNLNTFKYGLVVRAGYGGFTLFANYSLSPLFDKNKGPEIALYPLSAGIAFTF